jgi:hypothetical protein
VLFCFFTLTVNAYADTVFMENGDKITGKVKTIANGKMDLVTLYAGEIKVELSAVGNLRTDAKVTLKLANGTEVSGTIDRLEAKQLYVIDTAKSLRKLELAQVKSLVTAEESTQSVQPAQQKIAAQTPVQPQISERVPFTGNLLADWTGGMDFGFSLTRGNASTSQFTLLANTKKKFGKNSVAINTSSLHGSQNGVQSLSANRLDLRFDHFISDKGFIYLVNEVESNNPKKLKLRHTQGGGFGWQVSNKERLKLSGFGGFGTLRQTFLDAPSTLGVEGRIGEEIVLMGEQGTEVITPQEMAEWAGTIPYEILTGISDRVPRVYIR